MHRPTAVGLVDLQRRDGDRAGGLRQVHPELTEEAVRPDGALLDRDQALEVGPRLLEQRRLRQQVAGRVPADVGRERRQVEQLLVGTEHDLDLLDRAAIADEAIVDPAADQPAAELGERPLERRALADRREPMLERDRRRAELLEARDLERRLGTEADLGRAGEECLAAGRRRRPSEATSSSTIDAWAPSPMRTSVRVTSARSGEPTAQRMTIGRARAAPAGTSSMTPWLHSARVSWPNLSSAGIVDPPSSRSRTDSTSSAIGRSATPAASAALDSANGRDPALGDLDEAVGVVRERAGTPFRGGLGHEPGALELRGAQVDVRRVQQVRLTRQRRPRLEGRAPIGRQPVRRTRGRRLEGGRIDREGQFVERAAGRSGSGDRGGRLGT